MDNFTMQDTLNVRWFYEYTENKENIGLYKRG